MLSLIILVSGCSFQPEQAKACWNYANHHLVLSVMDICVHNCGLKNQLYRLFCNKSRSIPLVSI